MIDVPLNTFDILSVVLGANMLTLWAMYGLWRLNKIGDWDWTSIFAIGVPGLVMALATYLGSQTGQF